ncbi:uncharacterized protein N7477_001720 [Penicillium maclennaniae]|uniref:uncharacterized protein n=1 Tax=Penicillium maclennaniae TaxID=1343394 RepID=UPI002541E205|nr:uncharacterized protein N7477_001720 [Penicillium maclennaniae]KAJ5681780.1 hypothetical protein N7477_001720 [Penicillium maclennaniae]
MVLIGSREISAVIKGYVRDIEKKNGQMSHAVGTRPLYIVIDALDELKKSEWEPFLQGIRRAIRPELQNVKVFFTSRTEPELESILLSWDIMHLDLDDSTENQEDRALFLRDVVHEYALENSFEKNITETISKEIMVRAEGSFLWASLAWAHFKDGVGSWTKDLLHQRLHKLQHLPPGMDSLYHRLLCSVDQRLHIELFHVLQWIVAARRPLNVSEMSVALALVEKPPCARDMNIKLSLRGFLRRVCPHLIRVDGQGNITLVHHSFKAFLLDARQVNFNQGKENNKFHLDMNQVDIQLGRDCMWIWGSKILG